MDDIRNNPVYDDAEVSPFVPPQIEQEAEHDRPRPANVAPSHDASRCWNKYRIPAAVVIAVIVTMAITVGVIIVTRNNNDITMPAMTTSHIMMAVTMVTGEKQTTLLKTEKVDSSGNRITMAPNTEHNDITDVTMAPTIEHDILDVTEAPTSTSSATSVIGREREVNGKKASVNKNAIGRSVDCIFIRRYLQRRYECERKKSVICIYPPSNRQTSKP